MSDDFSSIKAAFIERFKSPLLGCFLISWLFWNWDRVLFVAFSDKSIEQKIKTITNEDGLFFHSICYPALSGVLLVICIPILNPLIGVFIDWVNRISFSLSGMMSEWQDEKKIILAERKRRKELASNERMSKEVEESQRRIYSEQQKTAESKYSVDKLKFQYDDVIKKIEDSKVELESLLKKKERLQEDIKVFTKKLDLQRSGESKDSGEYISWVELISIVKGYISRVEPGGRVMEASEWPGRTIKFSNLVKAMNQVVNADYGQESIELFEEQVKKIQSYD